MTQVQSDWSQKDNLQINFIQGKPILAAVALSGNYNDLVNKPTTSSGLTQADWTQQDSTVGSYIQNRPLLKTVATTGRYSDLVVNSGQPQSVTSADWNATIASGSVIPVTNKPTIPAAQVNADWDSTEGLSQIYNRPMLAPVALSNSYADLSGRPVLGPVATSNLYSDLTDAPQQADYNLLTSTTTSLAILNRPTEVSAFNNDAGYYKADDSPMFGNVTASGGISSGGNFSAIDGFFSGNLAATELTLSSGAQVAFLNIPGSQVVNLGSDKMKAANAGMIGYETTTIGAVDIYGAGTLVGSRGIKLWDNVTIPGTLSSGASTVSGTLTASGVVTATTGVSVPGSNVLNLGSNVTKETNAGKLGYALLTPGVLDVVGGGTSVGTRVVKIWDNVTVPGAATVTGNVSGGSVTATAGDLSAPVGELRVGSGFFRGGITAVTNVTFDSFLDVRQGVRTSGILTATGNASLGGLSVVRNVTFDSFLDVGQGVRTSGILSVAAEATTGALTASSISTTGTANTGAFTATGVVTANTGINLPGNRAVNFGSDVTKESTAGRIGYQTFTPGALDVVGAGPVFPGRVVKLWDDVVVQRNVQVGGALTSASINTPDLKVAGTSVFPQVNADWNATSGVAQILNKPTSLGGGGGGGPIPMPFFTSASPTGGFSVSASSTFQNDARFAPWKAFDNGSGISYWISSEGTYSGGPGAGTYIGGRNTGGVQGEYLQIQTPAPYQLQSYRLFGFSSHYLTSFAIMGSSDLSTWTTIDARTNQDCRFEQPYTAPAQTATFIYFRLIIRQDQTNEASSYTVVTNFAPVFTTGGGGTPTRLSEFTNDLTGSSGSWDVPGTLTASGVVTANTGVNVPGSNVLNFGSNLAKETNAGKIGYGTLTTGSLDIVGAGTTAANRAIRLWNNVTVTGSLNVQGTLTVGGSPVSSGANVLRGSVLCSANGQTSQGAFSVSANFGTTLPSSYTIVATVNSTSGNSDFYTVSVGSRSTTGCVFLWARLAGSGTGTTAAVISGAGGDVINGLVSINYMIAY